MSLAELSRELERAGCGIVVSDPIIPLFSFPPGCRAEIRSAIQAVASEYKVSIADIFGRSRKWEIVSARHAAIRAVAKAIGYRPSYSNCAIGSNGSASRLGKLFDRDHTTILYAMKRGAAIRTPFSEEERLSRRRNYYALHRDEIRARMREYRAANREKIRAQQKAQRDSARPQ